MLKKNAHIYLIILLANTIIGQTDFLSKAKSYHNLDSIIIYGEKHLQQCLAKTYNSQVIIKAYKYVVVNYFNKG